ncbi:zf-HC2 domain-containing protein [Psychrobacter sp.]|uniref:anti-sigma factor family protein n=1 Tax=Psychrobacter sp. TaxID=56811 RepID=UPI0025F09A11|nr:zf-HC2 domain-containing protein [Psychrobacter sp.]
MKNCNRITQIASDGQERPLTLAEKTHLHSHLFFCPGCRAFYDNSKTLSKMMKDFKSKDTK